MSFVGLIGRPFLVAGFAQGAGNEARLLVGEVFTVLLAEEPGEQLLGVKALKVVGAVLERACVARAGVVVVERHDVGVHRAQARKCVDGGHLVGEHDVKVIIGARRCDDVGRDEPLERPAHLAHVVCGGKGCKLKRRLARCVAGVHEDDRLIVRGLRERVLQR